MKPAEEHPSGSAAQPPLVAVLMCTFNGEKHLGAQLQSMREQTHARWSLHVSDDGSSDNTLALLDAFADRCTGAQQVQVHRGPQRGFSRNFFSLLDRPGIDADYYAFADQDDEWDGQKLERAIAALSQHPPETPALYGSGSVLIRETGAPMGRSPIFRKQPAFANALVQNMTTGNTMVLNRAALQLLRDAGTDVEVSAHDWWAYLLVTGTGGHMIYDPHPTIRYRQHGANLYGENRSLRAKWKRITRLLKGDFGQWNAMNCAALRRCAHLLTEPARQRLDLFERARRGSAPTRLFYLLRAGVYRQTWDGQLGLLVAALTGKI